MPRKVRFRPRITRIKLNPEQAVLSCDCYRWGVKFISQGLLAGPDNNASTAACDSGRVYNDRGICVDQFDGSMENITSDFSISSS